MRSERAQNLATALGLTLMCAAIVAVIVMLSVHWASIEVVEQNTVKINAHVTRVYKNTNMDYVGKTPVFHTRYTTEFMCDDFEDKPILRSHRSDLYNRMFGLEGAKVQLVVEYEKLSDGTEREDITQVYIVEDYY